MEYEKESPAADGPADGAGVNHKENKTSNANRGESKPHPERMMELFGGSEIGYGVHGEPTQIKGSLKWEIKATARTLRGPTTVAMWEAHIAGDTPLGIIPIRVDGTCSWACIDVDKYDVDLTSYIRAVSDAKLPLVCARSKSGGLRIYLFLAEPQPAAAVLAVMKVMAGKLGLADSEIFPKQTALNLENDDVGNWMVMPYFGNAHGWKIQAQVGLKITGAEMEIGEFIRAAEAVRLSPEQFDALPLKSKFKAKSKAKHTARPAPEGGPFAGGPLCLQRIAVGGVGEGMRNKTAFTMGVYAKMAHPEDWKGKLDHYNHLYLRPPLPRDEVDEITKSLRKKDYPYKRDGQPICEKCDNPACYGAYGLGSGSDEPVIEWWKQTDSEPYEWEMKLVGIDGELSFTNIADITNYTRFTDQCVVQLQHYFPPGTEARKRWAQQIKEAAPNIVPMEQPEEFTKLGEFKEVLRELCIERYAAPAREEILLGKAWLEEGEDNYYFLIEALMKLLKEMMGPGVTRGQVHKWIRKLKGGRGRPGKEDDPMTTGGESKRVWWVPASLVRGDPSRRDVRDKKVLG